MTGDISSIIEGRPVYSSSKRGSGNIKTQGKQPQRVNVVQVNLTRRKRGSLNPFPPDFVYISKIKERNDLVSESRDWVFDVRKAVVDNLTPADCRIEISSLLRSRKSQELFVKFLLKYCLTSTQARHKNRKFNGSLINQW